MGNINRATLPPGPAGRLRPTLKLIRDPQGALNEWRSTYGDPFFMHALNGPVVITGRADLIHEIFARDAAHYDPFATKALVPILGAGSMLCLAGSAHRRERKLIMPMFHGDRMRSYAAIMQQATQEAMQNVAHSEFNMLDVTTSISLKVIVEAIFGGEDSQSVTNLMRLARKAIRDISPLLFFSPKLHFSFLGLSPWDRFVRARNRLREAFDVELASRADTSVQRDDIMTMLTQASYEDGSRISPNDAYEELGTFLFAGHETTAISMAWAMYHLHTHPESLQLLQQELLAAGEVPPEVLAGLPYLKAVVQETLRMHPVITEVVRLSNVPMKLAGYDLPAGTAVAPAIVLAHYDENVFESPNEFRPERFLDRKYSSAEYLPFGGGHRRCAGAAFATYEMAIALGTIVANYKLELLESKPVRPKRRNVTMGPSTGIRMRVV